MLQTGDSMLLRIPFVACADGEFRTPYKWVCWVL